MIFKICDKCKGTNVKTLVLRLKEIYPDAVYEIGCQNLCGIGRDKSFVIIDHIPIIADNEDALVEKINVYLKNK